MRKLFTILFILLSAFVTGQTVGIRGDTVKIYKSGGNAELLLQNATRDSLSGVLVNIGGGKTRFQKVRAIGATKFVVGLDTITIVGSGGIDSSIYATRWYAESLAGGGGTTDSAMFTTRAWHQKSIDSLGLLIASGSSDSTIFATRYYVDSSMLANIPNLIIQSVGVGQASWYASNDSLYLKRFGNTLGLGVTTGADSTLNITIDSAIWVHKSSTGQITGAKTFTNDVTIQQNGDPPYLALNRMGTTTNENIGGIIFKDNATIRMYAFLANFADTGWALRLGNGVGTKVLNIEDKFGHLSLGHSTFTRGWGIDINHAAANYGADSSLINGMLRYRWINAGSNVVDSFKVDRGANLVSSGNITAEIDSTGTARNMLYQGANGMIYRAAVPAGGGVTDGDKGDVTVTASGLTWTIDNSVVSEAKMVLADNTTNNATTSAHGFLKKLSNNASEFMDGTGNWSVPGGGGSVAFSAITGVPNDNTLLANQLNARSPFRKIATALGDNILFESLGKSKNDITSTTNMADGIAYYVTFYIDVTTTITGIVVYQSVKGSYTPDNSNEIQFYSVSAGVMTEVATSGSTSTLWSDGTAHTYTTIPFTSTYSAAPGKYKVGLLYNTSAQTTAPALGTYAILTNAGVIAGYANSEKPTSFRTGQTALPASENASNLTAHTVQLYIGLY